MEVEPNYYQIKYDTYIYHCTNIFFPFMTK